MKKIIILVTVLLLLIGCQKNNEINSNEVKEVELKGTIVIDGENKTDITTAELLNIIEDDSYVIVDTRINDAFNGWSLDNKNLGGHIEGAVDFSYNWLDADNDLLISKLEIKGITKEKNVVLYSVNPIETEKVKLFLESIGFEKIQTYDLNLWTNESEMKLVKYENYNLIVPAKVVKGILDGEVQESFEESNNIKIIEASWGEEKNSYSKGHIPTAFHIDTDSVEPPPTWMLGSDEVLEEFALLNGFSSTDTVIVTGEEQMAAYRVAVILRYIGIKDVRVLNGGTKAWISAGYELETTQNLPTSISDFGSKIPGNSDIIETIEELKVSLEDDKFTLVDNRTWEEYIGESSGYTYHDKAGRIPNAVFGYAGEGNAYSMTYFRNPDNTMRRPEEFIALWESRGIDIKNRLAFMCGSGWRAAEILYYAEVYGIDSITLYSDGWIGWSNNSENPVVIGEVSE